MIHPLLFSKIWANMFCQSMTIEHTDWLRVKREISLRAQPKNVEETYAKIFENLMTIKHQRQVFT